MLQVRDVETYYGSSYVLRGVSLDAPDRSLVSLLGRHGAAKTTLIRSIMGLTPAASGSIRCGGEVIATTPTHIITRMGVGLVPQGRQIFPTLTVEENLTIGVCPTQQGARIALPRGPRLQAWRTRSCQGIVLDEAGEPAGRFRCRPIR